MPQHTHACTLHGGRALRRGGGCAATTADAAAAGQRPLATAAACGARCMAGLVAAYMRSRSDSSLRLCVQLC
jgi:hypothetical protein